jgi:hypothetical protein
MEVSAMRKPPSLYFFGRKPIIQKERHETWRAVAHVLWFTTRERLRVEWMVFYYPAGKENAAVTAKHFAISRKTFHKLARHFKDSKYDVHSLADQSKAPHHKTRWADTLTQEERIRQLRNRYLYYGKKKPKVLYENEYCERISSWKVERAIRRYGL